MNTGIPPRPLAAVAVAYTAGAILYPQLPEAAAFKPMIAFLLPTAAMVTCLLLGGLWKRDPIRPHGERIEAIYDAIVFRIVLFVAGMQLIVVFGLLHVAGVIPRAPLLPRAMPIAVGLALIAIGNQLPRLRRNVVIGIRTTRALADESVWSRTNRMAGYIAVALGTVFVTASALLSKQTAAGVISAAGLAALVALVVHSRRVARV